MAIQIYSGRLTDIGAGGLDAFYPQLTVRPEREATGPDGLVVSERRIPVGVAAGTGWFDIPLIPSEQLSPPTRYVLELSLFDQAGDGSSFISGDQWIFTAVDGGGNVADMGSQAPSALIVGPPWPVTPRPGTYFDTETSDLGVYQVGVV